MDLGSLGSVIKQTNQMVKTIPKVSENVLASIASQVLNGLAFIHL